MLFVFYFSLLFSQDFIISGYVRDKTNSPIDYVNVSVPGLQLGSVTDSDGFFRFKVNQLPLVLVFDHLLYEQQHIRITVENHTEIQVSLKDKVGQADIQFVSATRILKQRSLQRQIVKEDIQEIGGYELADVLRSQSSLTVTSDQQVRMQGLDPEYNLILLDGEPLLSGDESGVSLNSMNSQFIDQVEILQGAASFLYGSGAIAGVINIKSKPIPEQLQIGSNAWCEQKNLAADFSISNTYDRLKIQFNSSYLDGKRDFDERPQNRYQFRSRFIYELNDQSQLNAIFSQNTQKIESSDDSGTIRSQRGQIGLNYQLYYSKTNEFRLSINNNRYSSTDLISGGDNLQERLKSDIYLDLNFNSLNWISGGGFQNERFSGPVYRNDVNNQLEWYLFTAAENNLWHGKTNQINLVAGFRLDKHPLYQDNWSPKLATSYSVADWLELKAEIGTAFKAPSFSELFLNFEGATYRVIGANSIEFYLDDLEINGQLQDRYFSDHKEIRAEQSFSHLYNLSLQINDKTRFTAAYTANHIANYIELVPVALNNKSYRIYSYRNISGLRSRTATLSLSWNPIPSMHLNGAYIYTRAEDESVLEAIQKRSILNNIGKPVQAADYGGLFDRSIHQFKLTARFQSDFGFSSMLNLHYRGPFGTIENDADGNGILNLKSEYEDAFVTIDLNLRQALNSHLSTQLRIANLGDFRSTSQKLYGRKIQFGINYTY